MTNEIERESNNSSISQSHLVFPQANDSKSPQELLTSLSKSADEILRGAIALNPATPTEILEDLLNDKSGYVLSCLRKRGYKTRPVFSKPKAIVGNNLVLEMRRLPMLRLLSHLERTIKNQPIFQKHLAI